VRDVGSTGSDRESFNGEIKISAGGNEKGDDFSRKSRKGESSDTLSTRLLDRGGQRCKMQ